MKLSLSGRDKMILSIMLLLLLLGVGIVQFLYLNQLQSDLKIKKQTLQNEHQLLVNVENKHRSVDTAEAKNSNSEELQKIIPVKPLQDQFILDLEKAETISNSQIKSMGFQTGEQNEAVGDAAGNANQAKSTPSDQPNQTMTSQTDKQAAVTSLPVGVQKISATLNVVSPDYESFEKFITTLETEKRLIVVDAIQYTAGSEITSLDQKNEPFTFTLTVSAFYMPELTDLVNQLPKVEIPTPGNKDNPLSQFPDILTSK